MSELVEQTALTETLTTPYIVTRSKLGSTTKVIEEKFICTPKELDILYSDMVEKVSSFMPTKAGF